MFAYEEPPVHIQTITPMRLIDHIKRLNQHRLAHRQLQKHLRMSSLWHGLIDDYYKGRAKHYEITPKHPELVGEKIIWQYWAQGFEESKLPKMIRLCYASVDRHRGEYRVIRLSDDTVSEYIDLPPIVDQVRQSDPAMMIAYYSDILRLALLSAYGGVWFDSTIFMAGPIEPCYAEWEFFMFQRDPSEPLKEYWHRHLPLSFDWRDDFLTNVQNAIIFAKPRSEVICTLLDILILYWERKEDRKSPPVYLFFHILFDCLVGREDGRLHNHNCRIVSDTNVEILQRMMFVDWPRQYGTTAEILSRHPLQKLAFRVEDSTYLHLVELLEESGHMPYI